MDKNKAIQPIKETFPEELRKRSQWVIWVKQEKNGKIKKIPLNPETGKGVSTVGSACWCSFQDAMESLGKYKADGIGFVFTAADSFVGIDLDNCRDPETGTTESWAQKIIDRVASYTEVSPSGKGFHIITSGELPGKGARQGGMEIYDRGRFFTMTGDHVNGTPLEVIKSGAVKEIYAELQAGANAKKPSLPSSEDVIRKASMAANGESFMSLWAGDWSQYPSHSEADLAFCQMLAFQTDNDFVQIDNLFRKSGLYRDKWERVDYRTETISKSTSMTGTTLKGPGPATGFHLTDLGNSQRLIHNFGDRIRYCSTWKCWLIWDGRHWEIDHKAKVSLMARKVIMNMYIEASEADDTKRPEIAKFAMKTESVSRLSAMVALAKDESKIRIRAEDLDKDLWLLNCTNGMIDLKTGSLLPHDPSRLITNLVPADFDPIAECPTWDAFLHTIMAGNEEMIRFLQRAVGYSLTGDTSEQCFFILYGSGANGKSTFLSPIINLLNDYAKQSPPETFLNLKRHGVNNDIARLRGARFVTATEPDADQSFAEGVLKQLTGGDVISARYLHQEFFDFVPVFKLFLATNHKPRVSGSDHGIWRRIRLVPFEVTISKKDQDHQLSQKLIAELPGILAWAVRGCLDWQEYGLGTPQAVIDATEGYAREMDTIIRFIDDCCEVGNGLKIPSQDLYSSYTNWCEQEGEEAARKTTFGKRLRDKGFHPCRTSTERWWKGIGLKHPSEPPQSFTAPPLKTSITEWLAGTIDSNNEEDKSMVPISSAKQSSKK